MKNIAIFVSGNGSNMENIIKYFQSEECKITFHVFSNKASSRGVKIAKTLKANVFTFNKKDLLAGLVKTELVSRNIDLIVLAGFLLKIPKDLVKSFPNKIINIHPSLLPKHGGKGMYGKFVHEAVIANKETESGITIHYVNEHYDEGGIISQYAVSLTKEDTVESLQAKIHELEMKYFPLTIEKLLL